MEAPLPASETETVIAQEPAPRAPEALGEGEAIPASRCGCGYVAAPPAPFCPRCAGAMASYQLPPFGNVVSYTILHSPPTGFTAPLSIALVELTGGVKFICHGYPDNRRALRIGRQVRIEHDNDVYYFATMSLAARARLIWSRRGETHQKLRSILRTALRRRS
jgi:uncharacterized OB-fold protein